MINVVILILDINGDALWLRHNSPSNHGWRNLLENCGRTNNSHSQDIITEVEGLCWTHQQVNKTVIADQRCVLWGQISGLASLVGFTCTLIIHYYSKYDNILNFTYDVNSTFRLDIRLNWGFTTGCRGCIEMTWQRQVFGYVQISQHCSFQEGKRLCLHDWTSPPPVSKGKSTITSSSRSSTVLYFDL